MISYNVSGVLIDCYLSTSAYEADYYYNYNLRANHLSDSVVCYMLSGIKSNVKSSLHRLENLEQRYQGDNVEFIQILSDSVDKLEDLSIYISDNQYNLAKAKILQEQAQRSVLKLENIYKNKYDLFHFKDDDTVLNIAMSVTILSLFTYMCDSIKSGFDGFSITKISSIIVASSMFVSLLKGYLKDFSSPGNNIHYCSENMSNVAKLLGEVEEHNLNDGMFF